MDIETPKWDNMWFVCEYGNHQEFHDLAKQNGAIITIPGSASTAWFKTKNEADYFLTEVWAHLAVNAGVISGSSYNLIFHS